MDNVVLYVPELRYKNIFKTKLRHGIGLCKLVLFLVNIIIIIIIIIMYLLYLAQSYFMV